VETGFQLFGKNADRMKKELDYYMMDNCQSWDLHADGSYTQNHPEEGEERFSAQDKLMEDFTR